MVDSTADFPIIRPMVKDDPNTGGFDAKAVTQALDALLELLPNEPTAAADTLTKRQRGQLRAAIGRLLEQLRDFHIALDPIRYPPNVLDLSDP